MTPFLRFLLRSLTIAAVALTLAMLFARWHWALDLLTHFRLPCALGFGALLLFLLLAKLPKSALIVACLLVIQLQPLSRHYLPFTKDNRKGTGPEFKVLTYNVLTRNHRHTDVLALIQKHDPDFLLLQETSREWVNALSPLRTRYPYVVEHPRSDNFGILLYSKHPILDSIVDTNKKYATPHIRALIQFQGRKLNLINTHTLPPRTPATARSNQATLQRIAEETRTRNAPIIVVGDFNCTAYSPSFRPLDAELKDSSRGRGYPVTWNRYHPLLGIPIDHILYSEDLICRSREIGPRTGSDHSPIIATFQFAPQK
ncbi:MAG: endonuclease/exonuclease/phosphatase family protein [Roseibacillus sp.]